MNKEIKNILDRGTPGEVRALFHFDKDTNPQKIRKKFLIWSKWFFPSKFEYKDASFHENMDMGNIMVYLGRDSRFVNIAFRGSAKTARTKMFIAFAIANDGDHQRKYIKVLSKDLKNARQSTTDVYNYLISDRVKALYPEIFRKTSLKREETMSSFTTATGIKMTADSLGSDQRGDLQDESRPDFIWYDDFETNRTLMSATDTNKIWITMEEAWNGRAKGGGAVYTCNYLSERGNVHKLVQRVPNTMITSIEQEDKERYTPAWEDRDTPNDLKEIEANADDYEGEYRCKPEISKNVYFDRDSVDKQEAIKPMDVVAGLKIFKKYKPSHRVASGHDVSEGVGLDHSTSVFIDFDRRPAQVLATYKNNEIKPDDFAYEIIRQAKRFGENLVAVERNNPGHGTLAILKENYPTSKLHKTESHKPKIVRKTPTEFGWHTNKATKHTMLTDLSNAIEDGLIELNDEDLIAEVKNYTRDDLMDKEEDPRLTTRHFDLLIACAIAWQMNQYVQKPEIKRGMDPLLERALSQQSSSDNPAR